MASIVSTTRPFGLGNSNNTGSSSISTGINNTSNNVGSRGIATNSVFNDKSNNIRTKTVTATPNVNSFNQSIRQQVVNADTGEVLHQNRFLNYQPPTTKPATTNQNLSPQDRGNLNILNKWASKLKASNLSGQVTTYSDDPSTVPLLRRDTMGFFNVVYNNDGTYTLGTNGIKWNGETYGKWTLADKMSWNPIKAYAVAEPAAQYLLNYKYYDTKNKIIQGSLAFANSYSNMYDGQKNIIDDYAVKEWMGLVDMTANWKDRSTMQNAVAGLSTISGLSQRYGFNNYLGGDKVVGGIQDGLALYTFGNSVYQLGTNWNKLSAGEKISASLSTIQSGFQAYGVAEPYYQQLYKYLTTPTEQAASAGGQEVVSAGVQQGAASGGKQIASSGVQKMASSGGYTGSTPGTSGSGYMGGTPGKPGSGYTGAPTNNTPTDTGSTAGANAGSEIGGAASMAATSGVTSFSLAKGRGKSDRTAAGWGAAGVGASVGGYLAGGMVGGLAGGCVVLGAQALEDFCTKNHVTAKDRQAGAMQGAMAGASMAIGYGVATAIATGATIGSCVPVAGTIIGAAVGAVIGIAANSGAAGGHSREQWKRGLYRKAMAEVGIYEKKGKGDPNHGHFFYQLADGQEYNVGIDGHAGRATDINGTKKTVYNRDLILDRDWHNSEKVDHEIRPYDVDYTCNMDFTGSLLLAPLNCLGLGGSNTKGSAEYTQTLGYMTNAVTSNVGRDMTRDNWNKMLDNIKAGYERFGIKNKEDAANAVSLSYMQGNITEDDFNSFQLALNLLYDNNGYDQAMSLMEQLGRPDQREAMEVNTTNNQPAQENPEPTQEPVQEQQETTEPTQEQTESETSNEPIPNPRRGTTIESADTEAMAEVESATPTEGGDTETVQQADAAYIAEANGNEQITNPGEE